MNYLDGAAPKDAMVVADEMASDDFSVREFLAVISRRRRILMGSVVLALLGAFAYVIVAPVRYTATTTLVLDAKRAALGANDIFVEPQVDDTAVESHVETIKSEKVATLVVKKLRLDQDPEFVGVVTALRNSIDNSGESEASTSDEDALREALETFSRRLNVNRVKRSFVVEISFSSADATKAARIANAAADAYIEDQLQAKFEVTKRASQWLQQRISELRDQATGAFKAIQDFKSQNNLIVSSDGKMSNDLELEQLTGSLAQARADTTRAQSRLAEIETILSTRRDESSVLEDRTVADALSSPVITKLRQDFFEKKNKETEWSARYGPNHQAVVNLRSEVAGLKRAIQEEMRRIAETYKSELKVARAKEDSIAARITEVFQSGSAMRQSQVKLRELETASSTFRSIYENFLNRYTQAVQQQSFPSTEARVITSASSGKKTSPKALLALALAPFLGLGLGIIAAFAREKLDRVVYSRDQLVRELGVETICSVSKLGGDNAPNSPATIVQTVRSKVDDLRKRNARKEPRESGPPLILYDKENLFSVEAEAIRRGKVAIDIRNISHPTRLVAVVSARQGEGKSSIAISLAAMIAQAGRRALLIDCDLHHPSLSGLLGSQGNPSLLDILYGEATLVDAIEHDEKNGFHFVSGPTEVRPVHTADILNSEPMKQLLAEARQVYEYVIIDLPPILPVIDARACAHLFDAFIMVAEWGKTNIDELDKALEMAPTIRERLLGVVLNKVDVEAMRQIEGYGYADSGYYG